MNNTSKKTLVLGASATPSRYSCLAIKRLRAHQHEVIGVGKKEATVDEVTINTDHVMVPDVDTVTLYLNPSNQREYYEYIIGLKPKRIIFNPGTENEELVQMAKENNIEPVEACTLVMLSTGQY